MRGKGTKIWFDMNADDIYVDAHCQITEVKPSGPVRATSPVEQCLSEDAGFNATEDAVWSNVAGKIKLAVSLAGTLLNDEMIAAVVNDTGIKWAIEFPSDPKTYQYGTGKVARWEPEVIQRNNEILVDFVLVPQTTPTISETAPPTV